MTVVTVLSATTGNSSTSSSELEDVQGTCGYDTAQESQPLCRENTSSCLPVNFEVATTTQALPVTTALPLAVEVAVMVNLKLLGLDST